MSIIQSIFRLNLDIKLLSKNNPFRVVDYLIAVNILKYFFMQIYSIKAYLSKRSEHLKNWYFFLLICNCLKW